MNNMILINGKIKKDSILTHTGSSFFNYGNGFFETILYENGTLFFWEDHMKRIMHTREVFEFSLDDTLLSENRVHTLIRRNRYDHDSLRVKLLYAPVRNEEEWDSIVFIRPYKRINKGYTLFIHWEPKDGFFCQFKSVNYQALLYWKTYYNKHFHADEVAFYGFKHTILEASTSNILVVQNNTLYHADVHDNYLPGVMQKNIIKRYKAFGFDSVIPVKGGFTLDHLTNADEIFLSNSLIIAQRVAILHTGRKEQKREYKDHGWADKIRHYFLS